jgi:hypothetical protein
MSRFRRVKPEKNKTSIEPIGVGKQLPNEWKRDRESLESREDIDLKKLWDDAKVT